MKLNNFANSTPAPRFPDLHEQFEHLAGVSFRLDVRPRDVDQWRRELNGAPDEATAQAAVEKLAAANEAGRERKEYAAAAGRVQQQAATRGRLGAGADVVVAMIEQGNHTSLRLTESGSIEVIGRQPSHDLMLALRHAPMTAAVCAYLHERQQVVAVIPAPSPEDLQ